MDWCVVSSEKAHQVLLALSLEKNGDLEVTLDNEATQRLIQLLETALNSLKSSYSLKP